MSKSKIEWTETTWNPTTGCTKVSRGCQNCYAEKMSLRLKSMGNAKYKNGFKLTTHNRIVNEPFSWKKPRMVFVNSMSDLFHEDVPFSFIEEIFQVMNQNPQHIFQVLTKREKRMFEFSSMLNWTENIWMGVSIEDSNYLNRVEYLKRIPARVKFLSCEPLLGPLDKMNIVGIDWIIVGGESGPNARPIMKEWVNDIKKQCEDLSIPFFFKQWGGTNKKKNGRELNGELFSEMPKISYNFEVEPIN